MASLFEQIVAECQTQAPKWGLNAEDFTNEVVSCIWDSDDIPTEWLQRKIAKIGQAYRRRLSRERAKLGFCLATDPNCPSENCPLEHAIFNECHEFIEKLPEDEFERQMLDVLLQRHPRFQCITAFVRENGMYSIQHSYRKVASFQNKILAAVHRYAAAD